MARSSVQLRRAALLSVHTSPLDQPGTGDAGGMNVYVMQTARELVRRNIEVDIFTRATSSRLAPVYEVESGLRVHHITAGPFEGINKNDLPGQLCAMTAGVLRAEASRPEGWFDLIHSHYWLSGHVGWLAADRWKVPLVHTMHTMARVKNADLAAGDIPEPATRVIGEDQVVAVADRLIANTAAEATELVELYGADPSRVDIVHPGVDLDVFSAGDRSAARAAEGFTSDEIVVLFVGRIQPLKAPDVLLRAAKIFTEHDKRIRVVVCGGPSGTGLEHPSALEDLATELGIGHRVRFEPPRDRQGLAQLYRAADVTVVPSYSESFGLVAIESQACGTPVVAADVGGLRTAVGPGGLLIPGHDPQHFADAIRTVTTSGWHDRSNDAMRHAQQFSWTATVDSLLDSYQQARRPALSAVSS
jgi:D-inositol-3-phosphate glycosyltransferase